MDGIRNMMTMTRRPIILFVVMLVAGCASTPSEPTPPAAPAPTSAQLADATIIAIAPPAGPPHPTLPEFLGLTKLCQGIGSLFQRIGSRLTSALDLTGRFPGLQPKPPLLPITDPSNLSEDSPPAVKAAAEVKQEEDAAEQKIQALRYLATIGCGGCYPDVEDALLAALDDCTEAVRYEAAVAIRGTTANPCRYCSERRCCSQKVLKRMNSIAYETNDDGCYLEPSPRVRREARLSLTACGGVVFESDATIPEEGPPEPVPDEGPASELAEQQQSGFFAGVQLVSFDTPEGESDAERELLARVNDEPIYRDQLRELLESQLGSESTGSAATPASHVAEDTYLRQQLQRVIDWKLVYQQAARETSDTSADQSLTPAEVADWFQRHTTPDPEVTLQELDEYYRRNYKRQDNSPRVRWERVSVYTDAFASRDDAWAAISAIRQRALGAKGTKPVSDPRQVETKIMAWTAAHQITSPLLRQTVQNLPVGQLSSILEEGGGFHVIRVLERQSAAQVALREMENQLRTEILEQRRLQAELRLLRELRANSRIWTVFQESSVVPASFQGTGCVSEDADESSEIATSSSGGTHTPDSRAPWGELNGLPAPAESKATPWELSASRLVRLPPLEDTSAAADAAFPSPTRSLATPQMFDQPPLNPETRDVESMDAWIPNAQ